MIHSHAIRLIIFAFCAVVLTGSFVFKSGNPGTFNSDATQALGVFECRTVLPLASFDKQLFDNGVARASSAVAFPYTVQGGIIPHHGLASELIATFFKKLVGQNPQTVVLLGPNHEGRGATILTGGCAWETPFGALEADTAMVAALQKELPAYVDNDLLSSEHSIYTIVPYIKYFLPQTKIVPLVLSNRLTVDEVKKIGAVLSEFMGNEKIVVVAAVDFSHDLPPPEAEAKDRQTEEAIAECSLEKLMSFGNENLDSPASIGILCFAAHRLAADRRETFFHTNSGQLQQNVRLPVTSYFVMTFY